MRSRVETHTLRPSKPTLNKHLHPFVYKTIAALALWFVLAAWGFFAPKGYVGLSLAVVSIFVLAALALPYVLSRIARQRPGAEADGPDAASLATWLSGDVDTWQARLKAWDTLAAILLPIAAGAIGMTVFALVLHFTVGSA